MMFRVISTSSRGLVALLAVLGAAAAGCDGCGTPPVDDPPVTPKIVAVSRGGTQLVSDGVSTITFELRASGADGAETSPITVDVTSGGGTVGGPGATVNDDGAQAIVTPDDDGVALVEVTCALRSDARVEMRAENDDAQTTFSVQCVPPQGQARLEVDASDCVANPLLADGESSCEVVVNAAIVSGGNTVPQPGVVVTVTATAERPDGTAGEDAVLSATLQDAAQNSIPVTTDANGEARFIVRSPGVDVVQTITIRAEAVVDGAATSRTLELDVDPFENSSAVNLSASATNISGGDDVTITVAALNARGDPGSGIVTLSVAASSGASFTVDGGADDETQVVLNNQGTGTAVLATPSDITAEQTIVVTATYAPGSGLPEVTDQIEIRLTPPGQPTLNAAVAPGVIASDDADDDQATVTVTVTRDGDPVANQDVLVTIDDPDLTKIRFVGGGVTDAGLDFETSRIVRTNDAGQATIEVTSVNTRVRGRARILVSATVPDVNAVPRALAEEVFLDITRDPILQAIEYRSAVPAALGVRGGAYPTSSVVSFIVKDDLAQPLANVPVTFAVNRTANADVTVEGSDVSDAAGIVTTTLSSGRQALPVTIVATAIYNGVTLRVESLPITITAGLPNYQQSSMSCTPEVGPVSGFTSTCAVSLADRFSNTSPGGIGVQYRAEGGSITPSAANTGSATFSSGPPFKADADVFDWSYGVLLPLFPGDLEASTDFVPANCTDATITTNCNLVTMCTGGLNDEFCPLKPTAAGTCADTIQAGILLTDVDVLPSEYLANTGGVTALVDAYFDTHRACGLPASCFYGIPGGLTYFTGDECPIAAGCLDFSASTECPHDGLITIMASTRGEESFDDRNGDGLFAFVDANNNGEFDPGEEGDERFVDLPEPFLDKQGSCDFDDHNFNPRFRMTPAERIRLSDMFVDVDDNGVFGFGSSTSPAMTNGDWDRDSAIFFEQHLLAVTEESSVDVGIPCDAATQAGLSVACPYGGVDDGDGGTTGTQKLCVEVGHYGNGGPRGIALGCYPGPNTAFVDGDSFTLAWRATDANGNCPSPAYGVTAAVAATGPLTIAGATTIPLDEDACGLFNRIQDAERNWCMIEPALGAKTNTLDVTINCGDLTGQQQASLTFTAGAETTTSNFVVDCPPPA